MSWILIRWSPCRHANIISYSLVSIQTIPMLSIRRLKLAFSSTPSTSSCARDKLAIRARRIGRHAAKTPIIWEWGDNASPVVALAGFPSTVSWTVVVAGVLVNFVIRLSRLFASFCRASVSWLVHIFDLLWSETYQENQAYHYILSKVRLRLGYSVHE